MNVLRVMSFCLLSAVAGPALAQPTQENHPACTGAPAPLPPAYAAWASRTPLTSAAAAADLARAEIVPGQAVTADLHPTREVAYPVQPEKPGGSVAKGGLLQVRIEQPGVYRFAISSGAWLDVLKDGKAVVSVAHGGGPACTGIRKMVDFPLDPGRYVLQVSANPDPQITIAVLRQP